MPSYLVGFRSGGELLISGYPWSGVAPPIPQGAIQLAVDREASGSIYVGFSGGITYKSGGFFLSGGGMLDGMQVKPGGSYLIPKIATNTSGFVNIYVTCDPAASGQARVYWEAF